MKLNIKFLKIALLLITFSLVFVSFTYGWYVKINSVTGNNVGGSTQEITDDGLISTDDDDSTQAKTYKLHETINFKLKSTREFSTIKIKFEQTELSETSYKENSKLYPNLIKSQFLKNSIAYEPSEEENINLMYNMYKNNNIVDFYSGILTVESDNSKTSYELASRGENETNTRTFSGFSGEIDQEFSIQLSFGTSIYPSFTNDNITYSATNYNCYLIGLNLLITFIAE